MKKKRMLMAVLCVCLIGSVASAGLLTWTGNVDNDTYNEANWDLDGGATPDNTINHNVAVNHNMLVNDSSATLDDGSALNILVIGDSYTLTVTAGQLTNDGRGINGVDGGVKSYINLTGGKVTTKWLNKDLDVTLGGSGELEIIGTDTSIGDTVTINFTSTTSTFYMPNQTVDDFTTYHIGNITVNGAAAVIDTNLSVVSDGSTGSIITAIPEPATMVLLGLGSLIAIRRKR